ncbi:hypothetical protein P153DRAFT_356604 [Dothidotthia symphoricarpi CBS 119687]|uniref:BTB domain-containing protein n=1 Tax=Dothidotthia symphoricarpi CBS 119687 TaxID=1392245 RepID=A0A6A6ADG0_9PLEO|nr:uncharacterized protein P153DRAFT_356604 [Dothidotthia symphoricarpi CBS 119687]KAF2129932.1 hypothetical protein P153DRAFT_356604 [Dothidotthia symphoricarpi CBS 119687]
MANDTNNTVVSNKKVINFNDIVRVEVGVDDHFKVFTVHAEFLTARSLFFKKALSGGWKEAEERIVRLPEDDTDTFILYLHYLYKSELPIEPDPVPSGYSGVEEYIKLAKLYVFAEKMQDIPCKNAIIKALVSRIYMKRDSGRWYAFSTFSTRVIYKGTLPGSPARRLLVDVFTYNAEDSWIAGSSAWPEEFVRELAISLLGFRAISDSHPAMKDGGMAYMEVEAKEVA